MLTIKALYPFPSLIPLSTHIKHAIKINTFCFSLLLHKTPALEGLVMGGALGKLNGCEDNFTI